MKSSGQNGVHSQDAAEFAEEEQNPGPGPARRRRGQPIKNALEFSDKISFAIHRLAHQVTIYFKSHKIALRAQWWQHSTMDLHICFLNQLPWV